MYARNLQKNAVRASPGFFAQSDRLARSPRNENSYRYHIPPGYVGNRFRTTDTPETKHHAPTDELVSSIERQTDEVPLYGDPLGTDTDSLLMQGAPSDLEGEKAEELGEKEEETSTAVSVHPNGVPIPPSAALADLLQALRNRVSFEDLLLIFLILTIAKEGEQGGETILLLTLLLLVK